MRLIALEADELTILDWGHAGVGHPLLDAPAFMERAPTEMAAALKDHWIASLSARFPRSDPARAWEIIEPIATARRAAVYLGFLDHIEPSEYPYHRDDPRESMEQVAVVLKRPQPERSAYLV